MSKNYKRAEKFLRNKDGTIITTDDKISDKWVRYFGELLNCLEPENPFPFDDSPRNLTNCSAPTKEEILMQIRFLKNHKAPREDGIAGELLKNLGNELTEYIYLLVKEMWKKEVIPEDWKTAIICPIYKNGDRQSCSNYRGIALLNVTYKILSNCILDRMRPWAEEILGDYQAGFRKNRSTIDQIFILRLILQKMRDFNKEVHMIFIDFKKAYDCIHREF